MSFKVISFLAGVAFCGLAIAAAQDPVAALPIGSSNGGAARPPGLVDVVLNGVAVEESELEAHLIVGLDITKSQGHFYCGGALIDRALVLTAGHCIHGAIGIEVVFGTNLSSSRRIRAKAFWAHPQFKYDPAADSAENDLAVLQLTASVPESFGYPVLPIVAPRSQEGDKVVLIGYGITDRSNRRSFGRLTSGLTRVVGFRGGTVFFTNQPWAGSSDNKTGCKGDSGSPVLTLLDGQPVILGIISGSGADYDAGKDALCDSTTVATMPSAKLYADWIKEIINKVQR
jgi:elastase-2